MGYDTCVCSHKFININLQNLSKKMFKSDEVGYIIKEGYDLGDFGPNEENEFEPDPAEEHLIDNNDLDPEEKKNKI